MFQFLFLPCRLLTSPEYPDIIRYMIVVDVETTGVDPRLCSLLSLGALDFDRPEHQFYMECAPFPGAHIEKEALAVSGFTMEDIEANNQSPNANNQKKTDRAVVEAFLEWMRTCSEWTLCGQNPSFDRDFLQETAHRYHLNWPLAHRTVDLHSVAYGDHLQRGKSIPLTHNHSALNLDTILAYVGLPSRQGSHHALDDAKLEAEALSRLIHKRGLLKEYSQFEIPKKEAKD